MKRILPLTAVLILLAACAAPQAQTVPIPTTATRPKLPNPASVFCEQQGNKAEIRTAADGSQSGVCIFLDRSECDEWAYFRGECGPASQSSPTSTPMVDTAPPPTARIEIPTPLSIDPGDYAGWWTYTHAVYKFSILIPEDWIVDETTTFDPLMNGHLLTLHPQYDFEKESIRMTFRRVGEEDRLWPTGVGQGEFVPQGTLEVAGQAAQRVLLVCPSGEVTAIWYHQGEGQPNIRRGDLEFGFIFSASIHCEAGSSLSGKAQRVGEMIIASLKVP